MLPLQAVHSVRSEIAEVTGLLEERHRACIDEVDGDQAEGQSLEPARGASHHAHHLVSHLRGNVLPLQQADSAAQRRQGRPDVVGHRGEEAAPLRGVSTVSSGTSHALIFDSYPRFA